MDNYKKIEENLSFFQKNNNFNTILYGKSYLGQNLYAFHKGSNLGKQLLITASIHAREYISSDIVFKLMNDYNIDMGCYFIPLVNPDGVRICLEWIDWIENEGIKNLLLQLNNNSTNFKLWKANARGVDLNVNFDAGWGESKYTKCVPSASGYIGEFANSEIENRNLLNFIKNKNICYALNYHSKGNVVYYGFEKLNNYQYKTSKRHAVYLAKKLKYKAVRSIGSTGGLSDYLFYKCNIPSLTIELGNDNFNHPIKLAWSDIIYKNHYIALQKFINKVKHDFRFT